ncbi:MAG: molecular chaperone TorD [Planctomycetes bacterium]|nr:molecular chaperone TorD [Planctomycetota bacterium]
MPSKVRSDIQVTEEELYRAQVYQLLARLLGAPVDDELIDILKNIDGDDSPLGVALNGLKDLAHRITLEEAVDEYSELFIGVTQGELIPFKSFYLTGFLNEKPLGEVRAHMEEIGIAKSDDEGDPEDHIASLFEMMNGMIDGSFGKPFTLPEQVRFFDNHIGNWAPKFFRDLEVAEAARFYVPVGRIGKLFMDVESEAFLIAA